MTHYTGNLLKMGSALKNGRVEYTLGLDEARLALNDLIGEKLKWAFHGRINCIKCGALTRKSFGQGFCYNCFTTAPEAEACVLRPELCKAQWGIAREPEFAAAHCLQPHYVYLALTGSLKVGVTRQSQVPVRWIDQGASAALKICRTPNRHIAGIIETFLKQYFSDKTSWRKMLVDEHVNPADLMAARDKAFSLLPKELLQYALPDDEIMNIKYPVALWPNNPEQVNLDKDQDGDGVLNGIKGQYLLLENNQVLNIRRFSGYRIEMDVIENS